METDWFSKILGTKHFWFLIPFGPVLTELTKLLAKVKTTTKMQFLRKFGQHYLYFR